jgi:hypothetical protein
MGTNYYAHIKKVDELKEQIEKILHREIFIDGYPFHLGKASVGWKFHLQYPDDNSYHDWPSMKEWLKDKIIKNEYGEEISYEGFIEMVEAMQKIEEPPVIHNRWRARHRLVIDGYIFYKGDFS